jgi:hypothetical protein
VRPRGVVSWGSPIGGGAARAELRPCGAHSANSSDCPRRWWGFPRSGGSAWAAIAPPSHSQRSTGSYGICFLSLVTTAENATSLRAERGRRCARWVLGLIALTV